MKVFLSALDSGLTLDQVAKIYEANNNTFNYNLLSYFYLRNNKKAASFVIEKTKEVLIDSGAHSFQKGKKVEWVEYTQEYANWIQENDRESILGFFEMDIDPAGYSYEYVKSLRSILTSVSNKIIPVWHKNRGIEDFKDMCKNPIHKDRIIAITGFKNQDIKDEDYIKYVNFAHKYKCKVHCLGMTRQKIMDKVPFDFVDSSSWKQYTIFGKYRGVKISRNTVIRGKTLLDMHIGNYKEGVKMQNRYMMKWGRYLHRIHKEGDNNR